MSERVIVLVPPRRRAMAGVPGRELQVFGGWPMPEGRLGVWLGEPGARTGQRWPLTNVTPEELREWQVAAPPPEQEERRA